MDQDMKDLNVGENSNEFYQIMVVLKLKRPDLDSGCNIDRKAKFRDFKIEHPGPSNQYFLPKKPNNN